MGPAAGSFHYACETKADEEEGGHKSGDNKEHSAVGGALAGVADFART